jgi:preprotein translocase subunit Sec63
MQKYFNILGLSEKASLADIRKSYYTLAKKYHPDKNITNTSERFKEINEAYKNIINHRETNISPFFEKSSKPSDHFLKKSTSTHVYIKNGIKYTKIITTINNNGNLQTNEKIYEEPI